MLVLPKRLLQLAELVLPGRPMADVGTDHALLPAWLRMHDRVPRAIGTDVHEAPLRQTRARFASLDTDGLELRQGPGLEPLAPGEVATIVIAGMGGDRIASILERSPEIVRSTARLVLQPNTRWTSTRRFLAARGLALVDERLVARGRHIYLVLVVDPAASPEPAWSEPDFVLGPHLRRRRPPLYVRWRRERIQSLERALSRARAASDESSRVRLESELALILEEVDP